MVPAAADAREEDAAAVVGVAAFADPPVAAKLIDMTAIRPTRQRELGRNFEMDTCTFPPLKNLCLRSGNTVGPERRCIRGALASARSARPPRLLSANFGQLLPYHSTSVQSLLSTYRPVKAREPRDDERCRQALFGQTRLPALGFEAAFSSRRASNTLRSDTPGLTRFGTAPAAGYTRCRTGREGGAPALIGYCERWNAQRVMS